MVKKPKRRVRVKQTIIKALAKIASREEEGLAQIVQLVWKRYLKKAYKKKTRKPKSAGQRKNRAAARAK